MAPNSSDVVLLLGKGDGTFGGLYIYSVGGSGVAEAVADFDGDGRPDLAVAVSDSTVRVLRDRATGGFDPALTILGSLDRPTSIAIGDFNGDGKQDFVVGDTSGHITVFLNTSVPTDRIFANGFN